MSEKPKRKKSPGKKRKQAYEQREKLTINLSYSHYPLVEQLAKHNFNFIVAKNQPTEWDLLWTDTCFHPERIGSLSLHQKMNHFPGMWNLHQKNNLAKNLNKMYKLYPKEYNFYPRTWNIPADKKYITNYLKPKQSEKRQKKGDNVNNSQNNEEHKDKKQKRIKSVLICKPYASCMGKGISLITKVSEMPKEGKWIVQEYINNPSTWNGLKFDLRIYVLVVACDPLRVFLYKDGLVRLATEKYEKVTEQNKTNNYTHLTNFSVNKNHPNFIASKGEEEDKESHKRSILNFFEEIGEEGVDVSKIWEEIKDIVVKTLISVQYLLKKNSLCQNDDPYNQGCFEILGFDVMLDSKMKPYLLEVNHNPSLMVGSQVDRKVKEGLVNDTLNMLGMTVNFKKQLIKMKKKFMHERILTGRRLKLNTGNFKDLCRKERDRFLMNKKGNYERIFPPESKQGKANSEFYNTLLEQAERASYYQQTVVYLKPRSNYYKHTVSQNALTRYQQLLKLNKANLNKSTTNVQKMALKHAVPLSPYVQNFKKSFKKEIKEIEEKNDNSGEKKSAKKKGSLVELQNTNPISRFKLNRNKSEEESDLGSKFTSLGTKLQKISENQSKQEHLPNIHKKPLKKKIVRRKYEVNPQMLYSPYVSKKIKNSLEFRLRKLRSVELKQLKSISSNPDFSHIHERQKELVLLN